MVTKRKTRLLLIALLGVFVLAAVVQGLLAPSDNGPAGRPAGPAESGAAVPADDAAPSALDTFDNVLLIYADGLTHVAQRYLDAKSYDTGIVLLDRVVRVRRSVLGPDDPSVLEAQSRLAAAIRAEHGDIDPGPGRGDGAAPR